MSFAKNICGEDSSSLWILSHFLLPIEMFEVRRTLVNKATFLSLVCGKSCTKKLEVRAQSSGEAVAGSEIAM